MSKPTVVAGLSLPGAVCRLSSVSLGIGSVIEQAPKSYSNLRDKSPLSVIKFEGNSIRGSLSSLQNCQGPLLMLQPRSGIQLCLTCMRQIPTSNSSQIFGNTILKVGLTSGMLSRPARTLGKTRPLSPRAGPGEASALAAEIIGFTLTLFSPLVVIIVGVAAYNDGKGPKWLNDRLLNVREAGALYLGLWRMREANLPVQCGARCKSV